MARSTTALRSATRSGSSPRAEGHAILIDLGGVLINDHLPAAATAWGARLGLAPHSVAELRHDRSCAHRQRGHHRQAEEFLGIG